MSSSQSWRTHKDRGSNHFSSGRYRAALEAYLSSLSPLCHDYPAPNAERQVLLSNVVACRLKIVQEESGRYGAAATVAMSDSERKEMCERAVEEAKMCIALNERWAKGHVRLASAYIAHGNHSNDACNSLQRALSLDPSNATARQMLMKELRRDREFRNGSSDSGSFGASAEPSAPPFEGRRGGEGRATDDDYGAAFSGSAAASTSNPPDDYMGPPNGVGGDSIAVDESPSLAERAQFRIARVWAWWEHDLSDDARTLFKVLLGLLVMYVALGGRFGLDSALRGGRGGGDNRGNYEPGESAYDRYYRRSSSSESYPTKTGYNDRSTGRYDAYYDSYGRSASTSYDMHGRRTSSDHDSYGYNPRFGRRSSSSYQMPNLFDGSVPSMIILAAIAFACHRFGINPFHALLMLNMVTGNRNRNMHRMGMMGMGYGMMRNNMGWGGRRGFGRGG